MPSVGSGRRRLPGGRPAESLWRAMRDTLQTLWRAIRPSTFAVSAVPVAVGTAWGAHAGRSCHPSLLATAVACALCLHAGANLLASLDGATHPGVESARRLAGGGALLLLAGGALGGTLVLSRGPLALGFVAACLLLTLSYALPPPSARGLGEAAVALGSALPVAFAAWLQSGRIGPDTLLAALVIACWAAAIRLCIEMPELRADAEAGRHTLAVRLGPQQAPSLYLALQATAAAALLALGWLADLPAWATLPPVATMLVALAAAPMMMRDRPSQLGALRLTLGIHLGGGLLLVLAALA